MTFSNGAGSRQPHEHLLNFINVIDITCRVLWIGEPVGQVGGDQFEPCLVELFTGSGVLADDAVAPAHQPASVGSRESALPRDSGAS